ncbi:DUF927 domain-containing protein [Geobacter anodireducens]|uniref:DUF927 domain-containing protein n=1 Tax=Geobacter soli TaxID=1510391 RepID=A0A0C1TSC6_9BACT|nr:DUF927 domain-containing protein [Geobacter soli]KIE42238.1 hypothetical protein SE37_06190 [Geobacter soli]
MSKQPTDFNDVVQVAGKKALQAIKKQTESAVDAAKGDKFGPFLFAPRGVFRDKDEDTVQVCSPFRPIALTHPAPGESGSWGVLIDVKDPNGKWHSLHLQTTALVERGGEAARAAFVALGGTIAAGARKTGFIDAVFAIVEHGRNLPRYVNVSLPGWIETDKGQAYVMPNGTVIPKSANVFLSGHVAHGYRTAGTLAGWQTGIGELCRGNSCLMFAVSLPLTAPLLKLRNHQGFIINLYAMSSKGKTTLLVVVSSVIGSRETVGSFNATMIAVEITASTRNDGLMILDETSQADAEKLPSLAYGIGNGATRSRATDRGILATPPRHYKTIMVCAGEAPVRDIAKGRDGKGELYQGQQLRFVDTPVSRAYGVFDYLHGRPDGGAFADELRRMCDENHGHVFPAFMEKLVAELRQDRAGLVARIEKIEAEFLNTYVPANAGGQVRRVAKSFSLIAAAGELGIKYGLLPWGNGEASASVAELFLAWLRERGTHGDGEEAELLKRVEMALTRDGASRFEEIDSGQRAAGRPIIDRRGWKRSIASITGSSVTEYFLPSEQFKEVVRPAPVRWAADVLRQHGWLQPGEGGGHTRREILPGLGRQRVYVLSAPEEEQVEDSPQFDSDGRPPF